MNYQKWIALLFVLVAVLTSACSAPAPTATPLPAAPTQVPATTVPPTRPPAPTAVPPTQMPPTQVPPPLPPPSATPVPPTLAPATSIPATGTTARAPTVKLAHQVNAGFVSAFGWSADDATLVARTEDAITEYSASDLKPTNVISPTFATQIFALSPDGSRALGIAKDNSVQIWNLKDGASVTTLGLTDGPPLGAIFTPDGSMVAAFDGNTIQVYLFDAATGKLVKKLNGFETAAPVYSAVLSPDNKTMAWVSRGTVQFMDVASNTLGAKLQFEDFVSAAQFTPDGKSFVTVDVATVNNQPNGVVQVWNVADGKMTQQLTTPQFFNGMNVSPTGTLLATATGNTLELWNWQSGGDAVSVNAPGQISTIRFSNDGKMLATGDQGGNIVTWSVGQ